MYLLLALATLALGFPVAQADVPGSLPEKDVLGYLEQLVQWQRQTATVEPEKSGPRELIFQDTLRQNGLRALRSGFAFARVEASIAPTEQPSNEEANSPRYRIQQRALETDRQIAVLKAQLHAGVPAAQRATLEGRLKLAIAQQELFETVQANFNAAASGGGQGMGAKIGNLQRGIPEMLDDSTKPAPAKAAAADGATAAPAVASHSLFGRADELFAISRKQRELRDVAAETEQLETNGRTLLKQLRGELDAITAPDAPQPGGVDAQVAHFKQIGAVVAPLAETNVWVSSSKATLKDWDSALDARFNTQLRQFGIRLAFLLAMLAIPVALGEMAQRAVDRYVTDSKRRRQAHTARRILVALAVFIILLLNFISDFSSFATFAGFITAGLAVALQGVLLALVAHFFFYGRYGVRRGDRVNVAGVTGDIVQIGMLRFYIRELKTEEDGTTTPTGKIVAFPNSILFQPTAFYKYMDHA